MYYKNAWWQPQITGWILNIYAAVLNNSSRWQCLNSKAGNVSRMFLRPHSDDIISQSLQAECERFPPDDDIHCQNVFKAEDPKTWSCRMTTWMQTSVKRVVVHLDHLINSGKTSLTLTFCENKIAPPQKYSGMTRKNSSSSTYNFSSG